jgi:hypothetical protein
MKVGVCPDWNVSHLCCTVIAAHYTKSQSAEVAPSGMRAHATWYIFVGTNGLQELVFSICQVKKRWRYEIPLKHW